MFNSLKAILEIYRKIIIKPPTYNKNNIKEIHDVLFIRFIISVIIIDWVRIVRLDLNGDFSIVKVIANKRFIKMILLIII
jgi:hypothetical protein